MSTYETNFYSGDSDGSQGYCSDIYQFSPENSYKVPRIEILDQPGDFRYRYEKEKYHGHILSIDSPSTKKKDLCKFPKIKVHNCGNDVIVRCWLISSKLDDKPTAHIHKLARKVPKGEIMLEPHEFFATDRNNYEVTFDYLYIVHAVMSDPNDTKIYEEKKSWLESGLYKRPGQAILPVSERDEVRKIDRNQSVLYFEAFDSQSGEKLCDAVSRKIKNLHNPETAALKIVNYSRTSGTCKGGDEVFMFVEKISKDVDVQFFETNPATGERRWTERAEYGPQHIHHQYGIVFRTPRYHDVNLKKNVQVSIELYRKTDGARSSPVNFTYQPAEGCRTSDLHKKRPHSPERTLVNGLNEILSESGLKKIREESISPDSTSPFLAVIQPETSEIVESHDNQGHEWVSCIDMDFLHELSFSCPEGTTDLNPTIFADYDIPQIPVLLGNCETDGASSLKKKTPLKKELPRTQMAYKHTEKLELNDISSDEISSTVEFIPQRHDTDPLLLEVALTLIDKNECFIATKQVLDSLNAEKINSVDSEGNSILLIAASRHSKRALETLLPYKTIDKNIKNFEGDNALLCATRHGKIDLVEVLLKAKFNPNEQNYKTGETSLHLAVLSENLALVCLLLQYGANPLVDNFGSLSPYDYSCDCQSDEKIKNIVSNKAQEVFLKQRSLLSHSSKCSISESDLIKDLQTLKVST